MNVHLQDINETFVMKRLQNGFTIMRFYLDVSGGASSENPKKVGRIWT